jgi:D-alanyl-lipoteichoic acid acyltransferase DltB (MBOAT superfamily)
MTEHTEILQSLISHLVYTKGAPLLFSSGLFWAMFLIFLPVYAMLKRRRWQMMAFVVAFNLYFYYKSSGLCVGLLLFTSLVDWLISRQMVRTASRTARRWLVVLSLICSLGILGYFKYANFVVWNWAQLVSGNFSPLDIVLPIGISFYTFQSISYIIEVYKGNVKPTRTWLEYAFFISFFPTLLAGPIMRANYFLPQLERNEAPSRDDAYLGLWLIIVGVVKKAIIADYIAQYNDLIFTIDPAVGVPGYSGFECLMGILGYTMQIYCDFSGYSDMAIGIAAIMGFKLAPNFNFPYKARNLTDFWRRWHISLSTWLRDYIYIPLGGNRHGRFRTYLNSIITMLIGGLWHGAAWRFVLWGGLHGLGLAVHKAMRPLLGRVGDVWVVKALSWLLTFSFVSALWVLFRADTLADAVAILRHTCSDFSLSYAPAFLAARGLWVALIAILALSHAVPTVCFNKISAAFVKSHWLFKLFIFIAVVQAVIELQGKDVMPFIYFQF